MKPEAIYIICAVLTFGIPMLCWWFYSLGCVRTTERIDRHIQTYYPNRMEKLREYLESTRKSHRDAVESTMLK